MPSNSTTELKFSGRLFTLLLCLTTWSASAQGDCDIIGPTTACAGLSTTFWADCPGNTYTWKINDVQVQQGSGFSFAYTFPSAGTHKVTVSAVTGGVTNTADKYVTVGVSPNVPVIQSSTSEICNSGSVTLTVSNIQNGITYTWSSVPSGSTGTGTSVTFNNISASREFFVTASSGSCSRQSSYAVAVITTMVTPQQDAHIFYRKRTIRGSADNSEHFWQTSASGTEIVKSVVGDYVVTQGGDYYIRRRSTAGNCWTTASAPLNVVVGVVPPLAVVKEVKHAGNNEILFSGTDKEHVLAYADYYWVSDDGSNPQITGQFMVNGEVVQSKIYKNGIYYLKGRDRLTSTWGETLSLPISLRGENGLNWVHARAFDGTSDAVVVTESKSYFDEGGSPVQSQTRKAESGYVFATQPLKDRFGRTIGSTLPAPILPNEFTYHTDLLVDPQGNEYGPDDFDMTDTKYNPNPAANSAPGTVGWYYSNQNTLEPNVGKTQYPYGRTEYYEDGTGEIKRSAAPGDVHRLGAGHESLTGTFPVFNELNDYLSRRTIATEGITHDGNLMNEAVQTVTRDENGRYSIMVADKEGKALLSARKGHSGLNNHVLEVNNTIVGNADESLAPHRRMIYFYILDSSPVTVSVYSGPANTVYGSTISTATYAADQNNYVASQEVRLLPGFSATGGQTFKATAETAGKGWSAENLVTGERLPPYQTFADQNGNWPAGFYRVIVHTGQASVTYKNYFQDVSYQFYDDMGRLKTSVSPNGYKKWIENVNPTINFSVIDKTTYRYNFRGWLTSVTEPDAGTTNYMYRQDGQIRFSQNQLQANAGRFSYTHYDDFGRPVESGEYKGSAYAYGALSGQLEYATQIFFPANDTKDWIKTSYDYPDDNLLTQTDLPSGYIQDFVRGTVSSTENENIKTWYSYDELGRATWIAQKPKALNRTFVSTYQYDFLGNVQVNGSLSYEDEMLIESFYHHYSYNKDKQLKQAFTSTDGVNKTLRATYHYYLHGPLKRVELGNGIQGIDFVYNVHGWLTHINHPSLETGNDPGGDGSNGVRKDVFGMALDYYSSEMEDLFPIASVNSKPVTPEQFHRIPENQLSDNGLPAVAQLNPGLIMPATQEQWTSQVGQIKEYFADQQSSRSVNYTDDSKYPSETSDTVIPTDLIPVWQPGEAVVDPDPFTANVHTDESTLVASVSNNLITSTMPVGNVDDALEFAALKALYDSLNGSAWQVKTNWPVAGSWPSSATAAQMDTWYGIVVVNGDITEVILNSNAMTGKIPAAVGNLTALTTLNLRSNNLTGKIPVAITTLTNLVTLDLYQNQLTGGIPTQIGNLTNLATLRLYDNTTLGGTIPSSIGLLTNLKTLYIHNCGLTGTIQPALKKLHNLENLDISSNSGLTGLFPPLGQLTKLKTLTAYSLIGLTLASIPSWIDSLRDLTVLNLDNSRRNGSIPAFLGNLIELQTLTLRNNSLTGSIPNEITELSDLTSLALSTNQLTGSIPGNIGDLTKLTTLLLYQNQMSGQIPPSLYTLPVLTSLQIHANRFSGVISEDIGNLTALTILDFSSNQFTGPIPVRLGNITSLLHLMLNTNSLSGEIPEALTTLVNLQTLSLDHNRLSGSVPNLATLNKIQYLQLHNNQLSGSIGSWIGSLNQLRTFRIDDNFFTSVDPALMTSPQLTNVYLNNNRLESVPDFFTYTNKANLNLYLSVNFLDFADLEPLFGSGTHGIKTFSWSPQRKFNSVAKVHVPTGTLLEIVAVPKGTLSAVTWEKQNGSNWTSINSSNADATQQTYRISNATSAINGNYRWRMTNTRVTGLTLESGTIEVTAVDPLTVAGGPALYNGVITSARWQTEAPAGESNDPFTGMYVYQYDEKYQVKDASWAEPNYLLNSFTMSDNRYRVTKMAYDPNGNIDTLVRYNKNGIRTNYFTYGYEANKNRLASVSGHASYSYNAIGQMTVEEKVDGEDQYVEYDVSGKVTAVSHKGIDQTGLAGNYYFSNSNTNQSGGMGSVTSFNGAAFGADRNSQPVSAYALDGINDYLTLEDPDNKASFGSADFTVSFWVKKNALASNWSNTAGISKWNSGSSPGTNEWGLSIGNGANTNYPFFSAESGATLYSVAGTTNLQQSQWYHLAGVREGGYLKIYVNGQLEGSVFIGSVALNNTTLPVYVGRYGNGNYSNAVFDDVKIYNRALTEPEIDQLITNENQQIIKVRYRYDDRGFRISKTFYPHSTATEIGPDVRTTWYIRDATGVTLGVYEQDGEPGIANLNPFSLTEIPIYGSGKLGTFYPAQDGSTNYEITDHLGNVRALIRDNINIYTATMEDNGAQDITNPRVTEMQYFQNLFEVEHEDTRFNHTPAGEYSADLYWIAGSGSENRKIGPAITLKVNAGDTVRAETWVRYENKLSYSRNATIASIASLLSGNFSFASGFEGFTVPQTTSAFSNAMTSAGFMGDGSENDRPFAYINYILFDENMVYVDAGWKRVNEEAGYDPGQESLLLHQHKRLALESPVVVPENGYIYIWVSNESEGTKVRFDDVKVTHTQVIQTQASDYGVWGDVLRELKQPDFSYRHGYQGQFSENDIETGWNHFELRQYDPTIGRWIGNDPYNQYWSPYVGMGNSPVNQIDTDGGYSKFGAWMASLFGLRGEIYQSGYSEDGSRESWGFNTSDGVSHFGEDTGSFWKTESALISKILLWRGAKSLEANPMMDPFLRGGDGIDPVNIEFDIALAFFTAGIGNTAKTSITATARTLGTGGEYAVGLSGPKQAIQIAGRTRIPDQLTATTLIEVKNVSKLSYTQQLRDFHSFAFQTERQFILYIRPTTRLSGPLANAVEQGQIILRYIPGQ